MNILKRLQILLSHLFRKQSSYYFLDRILHTYGWTIRGLNSFYDKAIYPTNMRVHHIQLQICKSDESKIITFDHSDIDNTINYQSDDKEFPTFVPKDIAKSMLYKYSYKFAQKYLYNKHSVKEAFIKK